MRSIFLAVGLAAALAITPVIALNPAAASESPSTYPLTIDSGSWDAGHIQGIAIDEENGYIYHSFTEMLVKTDLDGNVIGTVEGFTGHLGDLDFNPEDGRVYGSLEYKDAEAFYVAIFDVEQITEVGMSAEDSGIVTAVYLEEVVEDFTADMNGDGVFDGDIADTPDHRYGSSGIDGISFGPTFGDPDGDQRLMVAYGIYENNERDDNDYQVILEYDIADWGKFEEPLTQAEPHQSGPAEEDGKYFIPTGNTRYGVQNLTYDESSGLWFMGVYRGSKPEFPNYSLYVVADDAQPVLEELKGQPTEDSGLVVPLADLGIVHPETGITGFEDKADVGIEPIGDGFFYIAEDYDDLSSGEKRESATLHLMEWTGDTPHGFQKVDGDNAPLLPQPDHEKELAPKSSLSSIGLSSSRS